MKYNCSMILVIAIALISCSQTNQNSNEKAEQIQANRTDSIVLADTSMRNNINVLDSIYLIADFRDDHLVYGYMNRHGDTVITPQFDLAGDFYNGLAPVIKGDVSGLCDTTGKLVHIFKAYQLATWYNELGDVNELYNMDEGLYLVTDESGKFGFVNNRNHLISPIEYDWGSRFSEGKAVIEKNGQYGYIDSTGKPVSKIEYDMAHPYSEGLAAVMVDGKIGFINHKGTFEIQPKYKAALEFSEGLCAVSYSNEYTNFFFIDASGKIIIEGPFEEAESFKNGECIVQKRGKCRVIDKAGKELRKLNYDCFARC